LLTLRGRIEERAHAAAGRTPRLHYGVGSFGFAMEEPYPYGEDDVEATLAEVEMLEVRDEDSAFPASTCAALRRAAASIIFAERSIAVSRPPSSRSQTIAAATP
jgi:hypothetical protein